MKFPFFRKKKGVGQARPVAYWTSSPISTRSSEAHASFRELEETAKAFDRIEHLNTKRAQIALKFVNWYLVFVALILIGVPLFNAFAVDSNEPIDIYKLLGQLGTLLGSPLGFVVGYYFKEDNNNS